MELTGNRINGLLALAALLMARAHGASSAATASAPGAQAPASAAGVQAQEAPATVPSPPALEAAQARDANKTTDPKALHFSPPELKFSQQALGTTSSVKAVLISSDVAMRSSWLASPKGKSPMRRQVRKPRRVNPDGI